MRFHVAQNAAAERGSNVEYFRFWDCHVWRSATTTTTDDYDTFQVYTIQGGTKTYVARERLLFPWSKPANVTIGDKVKYSVQKNTLYVLDEDGKQHKAGIVKVSLNTSHEK